MAPVDGDGRRGRTARAAAGSLVFLVVAPGLNAILVPWLMTGWDAREPLRAWLGIRAIGALLIAAGAAVLLHAFWQFVREGVGTPAPVAPTERLVVGGAYRYVRNPMYLAVASTIVGQSLLLLRPVLLVWAGIFAAAVASFVHLYEEPTLERRFPADYERYRRAVPAWRPRLRAWRG